MTGLPKSNGFSGRSLGALQVPFGNVYSGYDPKCDRLRPVVSNPHGVRNCFAYQPVRFRRLAAMQRPPIKSHLNLSPRPRIARLFTDAARFPRCGVHKSQLPVVKPRKHPPTIRKTNDARGQLILRNLVELLKKIETPINITGRAGAMASHRQHTTSYRGGGVLGVSSGAIRDR